MAIKIRELKLTPNFALAELIKPDTALPSEAVLQNLYRLANRLQVVRDLLGRPIRITSGYRDPSHNAAVGGAPNSRHLTGEAADIVVSGMPAPEVQAFLKDWTGGMGQYPGFTHLDIRPERARW